MTRIELSEKFKSQLIYAIEGDGVKVYAIKHRKKVYK